ncbi:MAG: hypothetical protein MJA83_17165 [Gammaproteobacteria bacterium]|nr:hypothetical protein [Gammaproteobacteria bacterium]
MTKHKLVVKPHRPLKAGIFWLAAALLVIGGGYGAFEYGRYRSGFDLFASQQVAAELASQLEQSREESRGLREQVALLERSRAIDAEAREQVQGNLAVLQSEILELREELAFYRGIVSPEDARSGLKIQAFRLQQGAGERIYHYQLVLIQAIKHDRRVSGAIDLVIHGVRDGQPASLALPELSPELDDRLNYSFKYFQDFEGDIFLPDDFVPGRVEVTVLPRGRERDAIRESFDWLSNAS